MTLVADNARSVLKTRTIGDAAATIAAGETYVMTSAALTAARTWTLPAANAMPAGSRITIIDVVGAVSLTNTLSIARAGSDTINGQTGSPILNLSFGSIELESDGISRWAIIRFRRAVKSTFYGSGSGTHTTEIGATQLIVRAVAGGGGGEGSGTTHGNGGTGGSTSFGAFTASGGVGGTGTTGGAGGTITAGSPTFSAPGGAGQSTFNNSATNGAGGAGGSSFLGGSGLGAPQGANGGSGAINTGGGGGGASLNGSGGVWTGSGGGAGAYFENIYNNPAATYSYSVGAGGALGSAGTAFQGGAGASGGIWVYEYFNG